MRTLTVKQALDLFDRADKAITELDDYDEHHALRRELAEAATLIRNVIGSSHMGCAADEVLLSSDVGQPEDDPVTQVQRYWGVK